jgi:hypothetical protein
MNQITTHRATELTPERIDRGLEWLKRSLPSLNDCHETRKKAEAAVVALSEPAHPAKVMARVLALLNPYFDKDTPQAIREIEAEDWAAALGAYPYWAIEKAARWWKSDENPDRRKRPLEGDLVARTKREMDAVSAAKIKLSSDKLRREQDEQRLQRTEPEMADMRKRMAEAGNGVLAEMRSRMGGQEKER